MVSDSEFKIYIDTMNGHMEKTLGHWEKVNEGNVVVSNTPLELWQSACAYFKWTEDNPLKIKRTITTGKEAGKQVTEEHPRPFSIKGLCLHCGILEEYLYDVRNSKTRDSEYYIVISKILYIIYVQNLEYATVGVYSPVFTAKLLGVEKDDASTPSSIRVEVVQGLPSLSETENEVLEKLDRERMISENTKEQFR